MKELDSIIKNNYNLFAKIKEEFSITEEQEDEDHLFFLDLGTILPHFVCLKTISSFENEKNEIFAKLIIDILDQLYDRFTDIFDYNSRMNDLKLKKDKLVSKIVVEVSIILCQQAFSSLKFCNLILESNGLQVLFKYLTNHTLLENYKNSNPESKEFQILDKTLRSIIRALISLGREFSSFKNEWKQNNSVKNYLNYLKYTKKINNNKLCTCLAISFVASDEDIDKLPELIEIIPDITFLIGIAAEMISKNENVERKFLSIDSKQDDMEEVCYILHMDTGWSLLNLLNGLHHLSVNDKMKQEIYFNNNVNKHLRSIIYNGNNIELEYSLMLLWQLCFDKKILNDISRDKTLLSYLIELSNEEDKNNCNKNAAGILQLLDNSNNNTNKCNTINFQKENLHKIQTEKKHIMISYNSFSRELCLKIKSELEKDAHKIWIDVEDIYGSSLSSMSSAIENSYCVLICMTEKYKQSNNCRFEGEYVIKTQTPYIPLIMQKDYDPDGWLGMMLGTRIYIDFTKYDFDECMKRLRFELNRISNKTENSNVLSPVPTLTKENKILKWDRNEVNIWLNQKSISKSIKNIIANFDGKILYELYLIKKESPECFYKIFENVPFIDLAQFLIEFRNLFS